MLRKWLVTMPLLLSGCAAIFPSAKTYVPLTARIDNPTQYQADLKECHRVADNYRPGISSGSLAQSTFNGAASNAAEGVLSPAVPAVGAVAGAADSLVASFGITAQDSITILVRCILEETRRDHSAVVADPH